MSFSPLLITNQGLEALAEVAGTGAKLAVTKVQAGSGYALAGDIPANFTALKQYVMDCDSTSTNTLVMYQTTIRCNITPANAPKVFQVNELGVFASLNNLAPFLYAYSSTGAATGDTVDPAAPVIKEYVLPIVYSSAVTVSTTINMTDVVGLHAANHLSTGIDPLPVSSSAIGGLCPKTPNDTKQVLLGGTTAGFGLLPLHGATHVSTGRDPVPVSTTGATGLLPQLSGNPNDVLLGTGAWGAGFFPGFIAEFGGIAPPPGWLLCDGQAYSRITFANLYSALGGGASPWGQGDGYSTFNVPDLRGRTTIMQGFGAGLSARALGQKGGEEQHVLSVYEMAYHTHPISDPGHAHAVYDPTHAHAVYDPTHAHSVADPLHNHAVMDPTHDHGMYDPGHGHAVADPSHGHGVYDPGHSHQVAAGKILFESLAEGDDNYLDTPYSNIATSTNGTNVAIYASGTGIGINAARTNIGIYGAGTGIYLSASGTGVGIYGAKTNIGIYAAYTGVAIYGSGTGISIQAAGSNWGHNNMMPFAVTTKVIHV